MHITRFKTTLSLSFLFFSTFSRTQAETLSPEIIANADKNLLLQPSAVPDDKNGWAIMSKNKKISEGATNGVTHDRGKRLSTYSKDELAQSLKFFQDYREAMEELRIASRQSCSVPVDFSPKSDPILFYREYIEAEKIYIHSESKLKSADVFKHIEDQVKVYLFFKSCNNSLIMNTILVSVLDALIKEIEQFSELNRIDRSMAVHLTTLAYSSLNTKHVLIDAIKVEYMSFLAAVNMLYKNFKGTDLEKSVFDLKETLTQGSRHFTPLIEQVNSRNSLKRLPKVEFITKMKKIVEKDKKIIDKISSLAFVKEKLTEEEKNELRKITSNPDYKNIFGEYLLAMAISDPKIHYLATDLLNVQLEYCASFLLDFKLTNGVSASSLDELAKKKKEFVVPQNKITKHILFYETGKKVYWSLPVNDRKDLPTQSHELELNL